MEEWFYPGWAFEYYWICGFECLTLRVVGWTCSCHLCRLTGVVIVCGCLGYCRLRFDGSLADSLEENSWWYLSSSQIDIREFVGLRVVCSGDVIELATVETPLQCVV